jgi:peptidoglycan/xylan/chitin deacetylase (PgdA/CDA1 family)
MKKIYTLIIPIYLLFSVLPALHAADNQYAYTLDYSSVPSDIFKKMITINVSVGTCSSCNVTADGTAITCTYTASTGTCAFSLDKQYANLAVTAVNWTSGGTGAATKATLWENKKWAYSFTFDDCYAADYTSDLPYFSARGMRAGVGVVTNWIGGGNYLSRTQLDALFNAGWGILNHSTSHPQGTISCSNLATYCGAAKTTLESWYPNNYKSIYYIYPYLETGYQTCLSTAGYFHGAECVDGTNYVDNFTAIGWFNLYRHGMYASVNTATANGWADAAASDSRPRWNIVFTHNTYSGSSTPGTYDTNEATLQPHIDYVYTTYGDGGTTKNMWFAPSDEVLMYLFMRQYLVINSVTPPTPTITPPVSTSTRTPTSTYTRTATMQSTPTFTRTSTGTGTATYTSTASNTLTYTATRTITLTASATASMSPTPTYTGTWTTTAMPSHTYTSTVTRTMTQTPADTATYTRTDTPVITPTNTKIVTPTDTPAGTLTGTPVVTATMTASPALTKTDTPQPTETGSLSPVQTFTGTYTPVATDTLTPEMTVTFTWTAVTTYTATAQPSPSYTASRTAMPSVTRTWTPSATQTQTAARTPTPTVTITASLFPTAAATATPTIIPGTELRITDLLAYPNPYNPAKGDLMFGFDTNITVDRVTIRIYTSAYRRIMEETESGGFYGRSVVIIKSWKLGELANGTYYVLVSGEAADGKKAAAKIVELVILR